MALGISSGLFSKSGGNILISPKKKIRITGFEYTYGPGVGLDMHTASSKTKIIYSKKTKVGNSMNNLKDKVSDIKSFFERIA